MPPHCTLGVNPILVNEVAYADTFGRRDPDHVASRMTPAQIAEAQKAAREWKPRKER
jgi:hypothetical protein